MPRREAKPLRRFHAYLYADDYDWLEGIYGQKIGVAKALRQIVAGFRKRVEEKISATREPITKADLEEISGAATPEN